MATMNELRAFLDPEEPDYEGAARLGVSVLPHIESLVVGSDTMLASKATYLAGLIPDPKSSALLQVAASSPSVHVRLAAAASARHLSDNEASSLLLALLNDSDLGVRKLSLRSVPMGATPALRKRIEDLSTESSEDLMRKLSNDALKRIGLPR
jgi:HEAT repeat protein